MNAKTAVAIIVLGSSVAACSVLFDMGRYDDGRAGPNDVPSEGGSSGRLPDGATTSEGGAGGDGGSNDASSSGDIDAAKKCHDEIEANDGAGQANTWVIGLNCGTIEGAGDLDFFEFQLTAATRLSATLIPNGVTLHLTDDATTELNWTGGGSDRTLTPGSYHGEVIGSASSVGQTYKVTLGQ